MKKCLKIVFINIFVLLTILIIYPNLSYANNYNGTINSRNALLSLQSDAVGRTIGFTQSTDNCTKEVLGQFDPEDQMYCLQHEANSEDGLYVIDAYIRIEGNKSYGYFFSGADTVTKSPGSNWIWNDEVAERDRNGNIKRDKNGNIILKKYKMAVRDKNGKVKKDNKGNVIYRVQQCEVKDMNTERIKSLITSKTRKERLLLKNIDISNRECDNRKNMSMAYLLNDTEDGYDKYYSHNGIRNMAIHQYYSNNWYEIGSQIALRNWWYSDYNINNSNQSEEMINSAIQFKNKAIRYANNSTEHGYPEIEVSKTELEYKSDYLGPFTVTFTGTIDKITDQNGNNLSVYNSNNQLIRDISKITSGTSIKIRSSNNINKIKISLKNNKIYTADIWFIQRVDEQPSQRLITVNGGEENKNNSTEITIKDPKGTLIINKIDSTTGEKLENAGFKIKTPQGWLSGTKNGYIYNNSEANAGIYRITDNNFNNGKGSLKLENLKYGVYTIYEIEAPTSPEGYFLSLQTTTSITANVNSSIITVNYSNVRKGTLYIYKRDRETKQGILGAGFKIRTGTNTWLSGTKAPYNYNASYEDATTYVINRGFYQNNEYKEYDTNDTVKAYDNINRPEYGNGIKIMGLNDGTYYIYEVLAPTGYILDKQDGYDKDNNYVYVGNRTISSTNGRYYDAISVPNSKKISISGYVWLDIVPESKLTDTNGLWDTNEEKISGVIVRLMKKGNPPTEVATTTTGNDGSYVFKDLISRYSLKDYYIEFNYNGTNYKKYIPVAFNATSTNGSKAIVQDMPEYDKDYIGIATTYTGTNDNTKESQYGLEKCGTYNESTTTLENINLGIKKVPKPEYDIKENLTTVKITMKGFTYTYVYGGEGGESRIYAPQVKYQNRNDITAYKRSFYPSDIVYDKNNNTQELKAEVKYRIDVKNTENMNLESTYKEETMYLKQLVNSFDADRYTLADSNWTAGEVTTESNGNKKQTATIKDNYLKTIYDQSLGIKPENTTTAYINFSVNHDAILDILNHPDGIAEKFPTEAAAIAYHKYKRNDYSWVNSILKEQTHYTEDDERKAEAPYLIFTLGKDRTITGKVFEDKVVTENGEKLGNGTNEEGENVVKDVKVELLDATKDEIVDVTKLSVSNLYTAEGEESAPRTEVSKTAVVDTDESGNFALKGVVPGYYVIRYTYGDGTQEYTDSKGNKISVNVESKLKISGEEEKKVLAKDYKSTIVTSQVAKNALENSNENTYTWYRRLEGENYSVAIDSLSERKDLNKDTEDNIIDDTKENTKENEKAIIDAGTAKMFLSIENTDEEIENVEITKDNNGKDIQKEEYKNEIKGINFGIIEQPKQQAKVEKVITYVTLSNSQNNVVFDGNPETAKMQGVSDLDNQENGGSTYVRAEVIENIIYSSKLELDYEIRVTNVSDVNYYEDNYYLYGDKNSAHEITLKVNEVTDYLDETLKYLPEKSDKDRISTETKTIKLDDRNTQVLKFNKWEGVLFTNKANDNTRKTTDKVTIVAERSLSREDKDMEIINEAEITGIKHATETGNTEEEKLKIAPSEVHTNGRVKVVTSITPPTGENKQLGVYYAIAGIVTLMLLSAGIVIIKKKIK